MSMGIYKITNNLNNKVYIGCSRDIEHRWIAHKSEAFNSKQIPYNYSIHKAFRKYGIENFTFEIIENILDKEQLFEREKFWIQYYDSYNNGYNETLGGNSGPSLPGESNPNAKVTKDDVIVIRTLQLQGKMSSEVYPLFQNKISHRGFEYIWQGKTWLDIMPEAIKYIKSPEYLKKIKQFAKKSSISDEKKQIWKDIQGKKEKGLKRLDVFSEYQDIYSLSGFNKIWYKT